MYQGSAHGLVLGIPAWVNLVGNEEELSATFRWENIYREIELPCKAQVNYLGDGGIRIQNISFDVDSVLSDIFTIPVGIGVIPELSNEHILQAEDEILEMLQQAAENAERRYSVLWSATQDPNYPYTAGFSFPSCEVEHTAKLAGREVVIRANWEDRNPKVCLTWAWGDSKVSLDIMGIFGCFWLYTVDQQLSISNMCALEVLADWYIRLLAEKQDVSHINLSSVKEELNQALSVLEDKILAMGQKIYNSYRQVSNCAIL